jgi:hypothetical protein
MHPKVSRAFHAALTLDIQYILDQAVVSLGQRVSPTNVVFLHDPPTVGLERVGHRLLLQASLRQWTLQGHWHGQSSGSGQPTTW